MSNIANNHNVQILLTELNNKLRTDYFNTELLNQIGCLYYRINDISNAIYNLKRAISIKLDHWQAHFNLGNCYVKNNLIDQAIAHYKHSILLNPNNVAALQNLGLLFLENHNFNEALPLLEKCYEINKENQTSFEFNEYLADCYLQLGNTKKAIEHLIIATQLCPLKESAQHNLAILYLRDQEYDLAQHHFKTALAINPNNYTCKHMVAALTNKFPTNPPAQYIADLFDQYARYYNTHVTKQLNYSLPSKLRELYAKYKNTITAQNALDLGCGTGLCGIYFRDASVNLIGVDLSNNMLLEAKQYSHYDLLIQNNLQNNRILKSNNFDLIIAADLLPYFGELENLFHNIKELTNKDIYSSQKEEKINSIILFNIEFCNTDENCNKFTLQKTGRYTHNIAYLHDLAKSFNFKILEQAITTIRFQEKNPVNGVLFVLTNL